MGMWGTEDRGARREGGSGSGRAPRARAMAGRIAAAAKRVGFHDDTALRMGTLFDRVIEHRLASVSDERDPEFLHPGRTAIILMEDVRVLDYACVAAGIALDSLFPGRSPDKATLISWGEDEAARLLDEIGVGADDEVLTEALVTSSDAARTAALAERLDHARHLHLRDPRGWSAFHEAVVRLYLPLAARTNATLERRYQWWAGMFATRFLCA